jgi:predicted NAD-dependent protein-ADP-ribosyltransferase YbiA (DUF1768 family)
MVGSTATGSIVQSWSELAERVKLACVLCKEGTHLELSPQFSLDTFDAILIQSKKVYIHGSGATLDGKDNRHRFFVVENSAVLHLYGPLTIKCV